MKKFKIIILIIIFIIIGILAVEIVTSNKKYYKSEKKLQIPIYTYHDIIEDNEEIKDDCMQVKISNIKKQISGLLKCGYHPITYKGLVDYNNEKIPLYKRSCIITFDDGYSSLYEYAMPIAKEYNIPMTIFLVDNLVGAENYLTWEQIIEMKKSGLFEFYSHGLQHIDYSQISEEELLEELDKAYINLENELGINEEFKIFAYPYGLYTTEQTEYLYNNGYIQNLMDGKINKSDTLDLKALHRVYPLNDNVFKIIIKQSYKAIRY